VASFRCRLTFDRLKDVINEPGELNLIFEWVDRDLKKYMDKVEGPLSPMLVKVRCLFWLIGRLATTIHA
jgi:hypothetical protein